MSRGTLHPEIAAAAREAIAESIMHEVLLHCPELDREQAYEIGWTALPRVLRDLGTNVVVDAATALGGAMGAGKTHGLDAMEPVGPDHTSGVMRCRWQLLGGHVHCDVFGPFSGKAGDLVFRAGDEWDHFRRTHPNWQFQERTT